MREFMTKVSDYFNERRDDPERKEDRLSLAVIAAVAVVVVVLLLLFWWGYAAHEKREKEATEKAKELQEMQASDAQELAAVSYEEKMKEYMSQNVGDELRQEYLANTSEMAEKIRELQTAMEKVQKEVTEVVREYHESTVDTREQKEIKTALTTLEREVSTALENLKQAERKLADLSDGLQTIDREKLPAIDRRISDVRAEIERVRTDASGVSAKLEALEKADQKLWERFSSAEQDLKRTLNKNLGEIDSRLDQVQKDIHATEKEVSESLEKMEDKLNRSVEEKIAEKAKTLSEESLSYRYDRKTNTLYLSPNQKSNSESK